MGGSLGGGLADVKHIRGWARCEFLFKVVKEKGPKYDIAGFFVHNHYNMAVFAGVPADLNHKTGEKHGY